MAIAYNVGVTVFGGFAPLTVTWLIAETGEQAGAGVLHHRRGRALDRGGRQHADCHAARRR